MFDYLWIFHALYSRCRMAHFFNILPTGCKLSGSEREAMEAPIRYGSCLQCRKRQRRRLACKHAVPFYAL